MPISNLSIVKDNLRRGFDIEPFRNFIKSIEPDKVFYRPPKMTFAQDHFSVFSVDAIDPISSNEIETIRHMAIVAINVRYWQKLVNTRLKLFNDLTKPFRHYDHTMLGLNVGDRIIFLPLNTCRHAFGSDPAPLVSRIA